MNRLPSALRNSLLAAVAVGSAALAACVAEVPARPGVDYGYVAGTYGTAPAPYGDPYDAPYYNDGYYGYNGAYYGGGYYYGPSTTFVYTRDHYYPAYGYRPHRNDYRDDDHDHDGDHHGGDHHYPGHDGDRGHGGDHDGGWRPGRPGGGHAGGPPPRNDPPRPGMGGGRPGSGHGSRPAPAPRNDAAARLVQRMQRDDRKHD
jgi:hypothetical protein